MRRGEGRVVGGDEREVREGGGGDNREEGGVISGREE